LFNKIKKSPIQGEIGMRHKNLLTLIAAVLLAFTLAILLTQVLGIPSNEAFVGFFVYILYGLLVVMYFLRFALIFLGVFAVYRILRERYHKQMAV
jgi:hypothetical protein